MNELLRVALAIIAGSASMGLLTLLGRWWVLLALPIYVATWVWSGPVVRWMLDRGRPEDPS